jgi:hypothetical protein
MLKLRIWFNKRLQSGIGGYLLLLGIALVLLICMVCIVSLLDKELFWNTFYALGLNPVIDNPWLYIVLGVSGTLVFGGIMVTVFTSGVERSVERLRNGQIRYKHLRNHFIVVGWNPFTPELLSQLCRKYSKTKIILLVQDNAVEINTNLDTSLQSDFKQRIIVYASGTRNAVSLIPSLCLAEAQAVYLTDCETFEYEEIAQLMQIKEYISFLVGKRQKPLPVFVQINDVFTYNILQRIDTDKMMASMPDKKNLLDIHFYNFYENWARQLWGYGGNGQYEQLDFEPLENSDKHVHLAIVGFSNMGRALLLEALRICHYPSKCATEISIIDPQAQLFSQQFVSQFPYLNSIDDINIHFIEDSIESEGVREQISNWANDASQLLTIAICVENPDYAFRTAINLPEEVYIQPKITSNKHTRVLVSQAVSEFPFEIPMITRYSSIKFFGILSAGFNLNILSDDLAVIINGLYTDNLMGTEVSSDFSLRFDEWRKKWADNELTPEASKYASRYQSDYFRSLLSLLHRHGDTLTPELLEQLSESEHKRWIAERTLAGWRQTKEGEIRNNALRTHNQIVPYNSLSEEEKEKDRNVIRFALQLAKQGE